MDEPFGFYGRRGGGGRFGVQYSDGRRATLDDGRWPGMRGPGSKDAILFETGGGSGGGGHWSSELWVEPLPPLGLVTFAVEWSSKGIAETLHMIQGELFQEAARRARPVFPGRA